MSGRTCYPLQTRALAQSGFDNFTSVQGFDCGSEARDIDYLARDILVGLMNEHPALRSEQYGYYLEVTPYERGKSNQCYLRFWRCYSSGDRIMLSLPEFSYFIERYRLTMPCSVRPSSVSSIYNKLAEEAYRLADEQQRGGTNVYTGNLPRHDQ